MSNDDSLKLNDELINNLVSVIVQHDERTRDDMMLGLQYLSAVTGYIAASYPGPDGERAELLQHLSQFSANVAEDRASRLQSQTTQNDQGNAAQAAPGQSTQTDDPAIGIWKPG